MVSLKRLHFSVYHCVFFPAVCTNIGRQVRLILPNTYQEIYDTHACLMHALIFEKYGKMCVYLARLKSQCKLIIVWRVTCSKKRLSGRSFFSKLRLAGSGARKPQQEFEGSTLNPFFHVVLRLNGL